MVPVPGPAGPAGAAGAVGATGAAGAAGPEVDTTVMGFAFTTTGSTEGDTPISTYYLMPNGGVKLADDTVGVTDPSEVAMAMPGPTAGFTWTVVALHLAVTNMDNVADGGTLSVSVAVADDVNDSSFSDVVTRTVIVGTDAVPGDYDTAATYELQPNNRVVLRVVVPVIPTGTDNVVHFEGSLVLQRTV